jgi:predicted O-methyltransferase YrrM
MRLRVGRPAALALAAVALLGLGLTVWPTFGQSTHLLGLAVLVTCGGLLAALELRKLRRAQADHYRQVEALFSLYSVLKITHPLPPMRRWAISPDFATVLVGLIQETRPRCIVEAGSGVSTLIAGYSLKQLAGGRIVSLDHAEAYAEITQDRVRRHGLEDYASVRYCPLRPFAIGGHSWLWYDVRPIEDVESIDMLIIDGPPFDTQALARYPALPILFGRLSKDAIILMDDGFRHDEQEIVDRWLQHFEGFVAERIDTEKGAVILRQRPRWQGSGAADAPIDEA